MKKTKHILVALVCLLATVLLTVGCAAGTQAPEEAPAPDTASNITTPLAVDALRAEAEPVAETEPTTPPVTEAAQTETEPVAETKSTTPPVTEAAQTETQPAAETEPASQETKGVTLSKPVCTPSDLGFTSGSYGVNISDHVFYVSDDGIHMMFEGQDTLLYSGSFQRYNLCTDGALLYAVDQAGNVLQLDLTDGSVKKLFNVGTTAAVLGASENVLYIGCENNEYGVFWGYDLCVYSLDGVQQEKLGEGLEVSMKDGILCCANFHTDARTTPFRAYDRNGKLMVEADKVWSYDVQNGTVYYLAMQKGDITDVSFSENDCETVLYHVDRNGGTTEFKTFKGVPGLITFCGDVLYAGGHYAGGHFYSLENGAELTGGIYDTVSAFCDSSHMIPGKDSNGKWYIYNAKELSLYREDDNGKMMDCGKVTQDVCFLELCGNWSYSMSFSRPQMCTCYAGTTT